MPYLFSILLVAFLLLCLFLCGLILIQRGRGGGLASAFGGMGGNTAWGAKTGDVLTWTTAIVFVVFVLMTLGLNKFAERIHLGAKPAAVTPAAAPTTGPTRAVPTDDEPGASTTPAETSIEPAPETTPAVQPAPASDSPTTAPAP